MTIVVHEATVDDADVISDLNRDVQQVHADALPWLSDTSLRKFPTH